MKGCQLDFNDTDSSSSYETCKDKYPGLCQHNSDLCDSPTPSIKEAIRLDCPETCNTQFTSLKSFKNKQVGDLSICNARGRCKWSEDMDSSNLLPKCTETSSREYGSIKKCNNYKNNTVGECGPNENSDICLKQKCNSLIGCKFSKSIEQGCHVPMSVLKDKTVEECNDMRGSLGR